MHRYPSQVGFITAAAAPVIAGSGPAAPFVAIAMLAAPFVINLLKKVGQGCGQTCTLTSDAANQIEEQLKANLAAYMAIPRTASVQAAALNVFDSYWNALVQYCSQPEFQSTKAGKNCIEDRQAGACKWKDESGQCWNWHKGYREPIANDPNVIPDPPSAAQTLIETLTGKEGEGGSNLLLPAAALLALALVL